jgi:hypothetical protein
MTKIWQAQPIDVYKTWLVAITEEASDKLNNWELNFLDSIANRLMASRNLTEFQAQKLEEIYVKYTS